MKDMEKSLVPSSPPYPHSSVFAARVISALLADCVGSEHVPALSLLYFLA